MMRRVLMSPAMTRAVGQSRLAARTLGPSSAFLCCRSFSCGVSTTDSAKFSECYYSLRRNDRLVSTEACEIVELQAGESSETQEALELTVEENDVSTDDPPARTTTQLDAPQKKKKKKRKHRCLPLHSKRTRENAELVFDFLASQTTLGNIQSWSARLKARAKRKRIPHHDSIEERVRFVIEGSGKSYQPPPASVQQALAQFFGGNQVTCDCDPENDPKVMNRRNWETNVDTLVRARDLAVQHPLLWSHREDKNLRAAYKETQKKIEEEHGEDHEEEESLSETGGTQQPPLEVRKYLQDRVVRIAALHDWKPQQVRRQEAEALASLLADRLPTKEHDGLMKLVTDFVDNPKKFRILYHHLKKATRLHVIWIATPVGRFFYVDTPDDIALKKLNSETITGDDDSKPQESAHDLIVEDDETIPDASRNENSTDGDPTSKEDDMSHQHDGIVSDHFSLEEPSRKSSADPRLQQIHNKWNDTREAFVENLLDLYASPFFQLWSITPDMITDETEETTELDALIRNREERKRRSATTIRRKKVHLVFDAIVLQEQSRNNEQGAPLVVPPPTDRMIFIDNLPIDIEETDIIDNYSRCGAIESVRLYNQRPDLDPGPMSRQKVVNAIKNQRFKFQTRGRWSRPRTPLYGTITFATNEGFEKAMQDSLRIFGMVLRKHPVRSISAVDMTKFYIEGIPSGFFSTDVEHTVGSLLHPQNVYLFLGSGFRNNDEPTSCEFRFGTFEAAHQAFEKLEKELNMGSDDITLNWLRTRKDAMEYWTRKRGLVVP